MRKRTILRGLLLATATLSLACATEAGDAGSGGGGKADDLGGPNLPGGPFDKGFTDAFASVLAEGQLVPGVDCTGPDGCTGGSAMVSTQIPSAEAGGPGSGHRFFTASVHYRSFDPKAVTRVVLEHRATDEFCNDTTDSPIPPCFDVPGEVMERWSAVVVDGQCLPDESEPAELLNCRLHEHSDSLNFGQYLTHWEQITMSEGFWSFTVESGADASSGPDGAVAEIMSFELVAVPYIDFDGGGQ